MENKLKLNLVRQIDESYDIVFGRDLFPEIAEDLKREDIASVYAIITDDNVRALHALNLEDALKERGLKANTFSIPVGEEYKTIDTCVKVIGQMCKFKYGRDSAIIALGGGVVGDTAGFISAIFNRGIPYIQVPTTILAQADSAVGGKTGVDTEYGKNLVGAFQQPHRVYVDVKTLETLPRNEIINGLAETIKHGIIRDHSFFDYIDNNWGCVLAKDSTTLLTIARKNCKIKGEVVEIDPHEKGLRRILNYGHTVGHAVEKLSNFLIPHGYCVSIGMMVAGRIANELGYFQETDLIQQKELLSRVGLPITIPDSISDDRIIELTTLDKKAKNGQARYCLPKRIGEMHDFDGSYATYVDTEVVLSAFSKTRKSN